MSVAKRVQARSLLAKVPAGLLQKLQKTKIASLVSGRPANDDYLMTAAKPSPLEETRLLADASSLSLCDAPALAVSRLLNLTALQTRILRAETLSLTASEYGKIGGSDAVFVSSSLNSAGVLLQCLGFSREQVGGRLCAPRFTKVTQTENGRERFASACVERRGDGVYTVVSVD